MGDQQDAPRAADRTSHGADALRYGVMAAHKDAADIPPAEHKRLAVLWPSDHATQRGVTLDELFEYSEGGERPGSRQRI